MKPKTFIVALAGLAVLAPCHAQDGATQKGTRAAAPAQAAGTIDPAAKELLDSARARIKKVRDISCTVEQKSTIGTDPGTPATGTLVMAIKRDDKGAGMAERFRFTMGGEKGSVWAFDGETSARIDHGKKTFAAAETSTAFPAADPSRIFPSWVMLRDALANAEARMTSARLLPDAETDGVKCRVFEYTVELPLGGTEDAVQVLRQVRHVGAEDLLPRRLESWSTFKGGEEQEPRGFLGIYTNVKVNTDPPADTFRLKAPEGYEVVEAEPSDLGIMGARPELKFAKGDEAPAFALKDPIGKEVTLASLKGRVVLLDFWATWCGPCKAAMPSIQGLHEKYQGKPVSIIGVNTWEQGAPDVAAKFMAKNNYTYGLLLKGDELATAYGISGIPTFVLIGPDGRILDITVGFEPGEDERIAKVIDGILGGG